MTSWRQQRPGEAFGSRSRHRHVWYKNDPRLVDDDDVEMVCKKCNGSIEKKEGKGNVC